MRILLNPRKLLLQLIDLGLLNIINLFGYLIMRNFIVLPKLNVIFTNGLLMMFFMYIMLLILGIYRITWRYASHQEYLTLIVANALGVNLYLFINFLIYKNVIYFIYFCVILTLYTISSATIRLAYQTIIMKTKTDKTVISDKVPVAILGAGLNGTLLVQALKKSSNSKYEPCCLIDIDKNKIGGFIQGIRVYDGNSSLIIEKLKDLSVKAIIVAIAKITPEQNKELLDKYSVLNVPIRIFDYPHDNADIDTKKQIRDIKIEDLLFRESVIFDNEKTYSYYKDKVILVTGGGGSIGSELCRQITNLKPKKLIILDIYENNAYEIQQWLRNNYGNSIDLCIEIASVREKEKIDFIFNKHKPEIVFHAAAHKHVPLMEDCCDEAIKNNVFGTYNVVNAAEAVGVKKFIAISTDKAVNPTNVMGASKRFCEMIIRSKRNSKTDFIAVRFGNVLGSNGSVIPLFKKQLENGGPITLTDKRIIRYFMTISEATQLVMQAGVNAARSDIYVLDMGQPIKIVSLAESLIKLYGLKPYEDIDIVEIGLRPGEKLYEELLVNKNNLITTENKKIFIEREEIITSNELEINLEKLRNALHTNNNEIIKQVLMEVVPTFKSPDEINKAV